MNSLSHRLDRATRFTAKSDIYKEIHGFMRSIEDRLIDFSIMSIPALINENPQIQLNTLSIRDKQKRYYLIKQAHQRYLKNKLNIKE